jgi:CoA:oxalate CoA-transferase
MNGMVSQILSDVRVLEFCNSITGAFCSKYLADMGAEVIKIEKPVSGDDARRAGPFPGDISHPEKSGLFLYINTNKCGVTLDPLSTEGRLIFSRLIKRSDIIIEDSRPLTPERNLLRYEDLKQHNPGIILASITPFGQSGPYADFNAYGFNVYQGSGLGYITPPGINNAEKPPLKQGNYVTDYHCGTGAAMVTLAAMYKKQCTGRGCCIDFSMQEWEMNLFKMYWARYVQDGEVIDRTNAVNPAFYPVRCRDGFITAVFQTDYQWAYLVDLIDLPDLLVDIRFDTAYKRMKNGSEIHTVISEWAKDYTGEEICRKGQQKGLPVGMVCRIGDLFASEQLKTRDYFTELEHPEAGALKYPGLPYKSTEITNRNAKPAPTLGQHNGEIFCNLLGYSEEELERLKKEKVI